MAACGRASTTRWSTKSRTFAARWRCWKRRAAAPSSGFCWSRRRRVYGRARRCRFARTHRWASPLSPYAVSKRAAELVGLAYLPAARRAGRGLLRPFSVYGPRMRPDLAMSVFADVDRSRVGRCRCYGDGSVRRDFTHVSDICDGLLAALDGRRRRRRDHQPGPPRARLDARADRAAGSRRSGARPAIEQRPAAPADMPVTCADLTKAERLLGYRPQDRAGRRRARFRRLVSATRALRPRLRMSRVSGPSCSLILAHQLGDLRLDRLGPDLVALRGSGAGSRA